MIRCTHRTMYTAQHHFCHRKKYLDARDNVCRWGGGERQRGSTIKLSRSTISKLATVITKNAVQHMLTAIIHECGIFYILSTQHAVPIDWYVYLEIIV